MIMVNIRKTRV